MTWHWRTISPCDLDQLVDEINPQMKSLENNLGAGRPTIMSGYASHVGAIVSMGIASHTGDTTETTLKTTSFGRGAISTNGGFRVTAAGTASGSTATKTIRLYWGGIEIAEFAVATGARDWSLTADFWNIGSTQDQRWRVHAWDGTDVQLIDVGTDNVDTA